MTQISVALPVYNGANFLREALESILSQDFDDFELVISDNCSTDDTPRILAEFVNHDPRVRVHRSATFLPQAENVNRAVELCNGTWVKLFCHDDLMSVRCLRSLHNATQDARVNSVGLIGNGECWLFGNGFNYSPTTEDGVSIRFVEGIDFLRKMLKGNADIGLPSLTTAMVRKEAWMQLGGFDRRFAHFDVFLWTRLLIKWNYLFLPDVLTTNRIHGDQVAVSARRSLISVDDQRVFWREFLFEHATELGLTWSTRARTRLKGLGTAGSSMAVEILQNHFSDAFRVWIRLPVHWWPVLPLFIARSMRYERKKFKSMGNQVPYSVFYPS